METSRTAVTARITTPETFAQVNAYILLFVLALSMDVSGISRDDFVKPKGRGRQLIIWPNFPENYMTLKKTRPGASNTLLPRCATTQFISVDVDR